VIEQVTSQLSEATLAKPGPPGDLAQLLSHLNAAYNLARWLMRDETEAREMVQDAYLRAIRHFACFRGGDGRAWLLTIVRNLCYSRLKGKGGIRQHTDFNEALLTADRQTPNPEAALLLAERSQLVRKSVANLPAHYREVLVLRELEELSYQEIANITGIPMGTVMSRLSRARQLLHQSLEGYGRVGTLDVVAKVPAV